MSQQDFIMEIIKLVVMMSTALIASSGFWLYLDKKRNRGRLSNKLLMGMAHDRIVCLSMKYIERGFVTHEEYENLCKFLYEPYIEMGGNGSAIRLMKEIDKLEIFDQQTHIRRKLKKGEKDVERQSL